jgi:hypothetical protein
MYIHEGSGLRFSNAKITLDGVTSETHKELVIKITGGADSPNLRLGGNGIEFRTPSNIRFEQATGEINGLEVVNATFMISTKNQPEWFELD